MGYISTAVTRLLEPKFAADSASAMFAAGVERGNNFLAAMSEAIDTIPDDPDTAYVIDQYDILQIFNAHGLSSGSCVAVGDGYATIQELAPAIAEGLSGYASGYYGDPNDIPFYLRDGSGVINSNATRFVDLCDDVKNNIASAVCAKAAIVASGFSSVADRLTKFSADIDAYIDQTYMGFASTISYFKSLISSEIDQASVLLKVFTDSGADEMADQDATNMNAADISQYTGANPLGAFSFNCFADGVKTVAGVIGTAAKTVATVVGRAVSSIWNKIKSTFVEVFDDPYDVEDSGDGKQDPCFAGFQYQLALEDDPLHPGFTAVDIPQTFGKTATDVRNYLDGHKNAWYHIKTLGGECAIQWGDVQTVTTLGTGFYVSFSKITIVAKPYSLAYDQLPTASSGAVNWVRIRGDAAAVATAITLRPNGSYLDTKAAEYELANSFAHGWAFMAETMHKMREQTDGTSVSDVVDYKFAIKDENDTITNLDWLKYATGYYDNSGSPEYGYPPFGSQVYDEASGDWITSRSMMQLLEDAITVIINTIVPHVSAATNYEYYCPYMVGAYDLSMGRFSIKTDATNQNIAQSFMNILIAVAVVVAVVITGVVIARKVAKRMFWKRTEFIAKADNAMWQGRSLSATDRRKYLRYKRKLNALSYLTEGMLKTSVKDAVGAIDLSAPVAAINGAFAGVGAANPPTLDSVLSNAQANVTTIQHDVDGVKNDISSLSTSTDNRLTTLERKLAALEARVG